MSTAVCVPIIQILRYGFSQAVEGLDGSRQYDGTVLIMNPHGPHMKPFIHTSPKAKFTAELGALFGAWLTDPVFSVRYTWSLRGIWRAEGHTVEIRSHHKRLWKGIAKVLHYIALDNTIFMDPLLVRVWAVGAWTVMLWCFGGLNCFLPTSPCRASYSQNARHRSS